MNARIFPRYEMSRLISVPGLHGSMTGRKHPNSIQPGAAFREPDESPDRSQGIVTEPVTPSAVHSVSATSVTIEESQ